MPEASQPGGKRARLEAASTRKWRHNPLESLETDSLTAAEPLSRSFAPLCNRLGDRQRPLCHVGVQQLHHAAVELDHTFASVLRQRKRLDDGRSAFDLRSGGGEQFVADVDLSGVDQRLAIESHVAALQAFEAETVEILDVI